VRVTQLPRDGLIETFLTATSAGGDTPSEMVSRLDEYVRSRKNMRILKQDIFGRFDPNCIPPTGIEWPVTWVGKDSPESNPAGGLQAHAVEGAAVETIRLSGRAVGSVFEDEYARYCILGGLRGPDTSLPRESQARRVFEMMEESLGLAGMEVSNSVRTWLYIDDILEWYEEFNAVRTEFFTERGLFDQVVPASTGVGGSNPAGAAVVAALFAVEPKDSHTQIEAVHSPLQCPALDYGSSFSRAVEVRTPDLRRVFVSGTASIAPGGDTVHAGDVDAQVDLSMEVVHAILKSRGMDWKNVTRAVAYFKNSRDTPLWDRNRTRGGLPDLPVVIACNQICRDDLLFEIEVDAAVFG